MKKILFLTMILFISFIVKSQEKEKKFLLGANLMCRVISSEHIYFYPRLSLEYRLTKMSSFEFMAEYIDHNAYGRRYLSYPLSAGYKLNLVPWFIKNENIANHLHIYGELRYTFLPYSADPDTPFEEFYVFHRIRFAPGAEYYFNQRWGLNIEMVWGKQMQTTFGLGVKYRL